jgi:hypothetical protein
MGTRGSFPGGKAAGTWSWPLTSIWYRGQECVELYLHSPNTPSWCGAQLKKHRYKFTFNFFIGYCSLSFIMSTRRTFWIYHKHFFHTLYDSTPPPPHIINNVTQYNITLKVYSYDIIKKQSFIQTNIFKTFHMTRTALFARFNVVMSFRSVDPPYKDSYQMSEGFIVSELILNQPRPSC